MSVLCVGIYLGMSSQQAFDLVIAFPDVRMGCFQNCKPLFSGPILSSSMYYVDLVDETDYSLCANMNSLTHCDSLSPLSSLSLSHTHSHTHSHIISCFSEVATFFNFAKASVGSGSFALPWGILQCGVLLGSAGMVLLGIVR